MGQAGSSTVTVGVAQVAPVFFDRTQTIAKVCEWISRAADEGCNLVLFPEALIPAYPRGLDFGVVVGNRKPGGRELWERYWNESVAVPSAEIDPICQAAAKANLWVVIGVIERGRQARGSTLYCTLVYIGPDGRVRGKHRKLKPTGAERVIWGEGNGEDLAVLDTEVGRLGGLICWENYMPLARMALYQQGVELYLAPTADARETWLASLRHIACEGRCFVLGCNQWFTPNMMPPELRSLLEDDADANCRGGSMIVDPLGEVVAGPVYDQETLLCTSLDLGEVTRAKFDFDVVGHYARPDLFSLEIAGKGEGCRSHVSDQVLAKDDGNELSGKKR